MASSIKQLNTDGKGLFITGTDTGVGKTYIGIQLVASLHDNDIQVVPRKPIESGCQSTGGELIPRDAHLYFEAIHGKIPLAEICPYRFAPAISPQRAARLAHRPVLLEDVVKACTANVTPGDFLVVEGAGGFYSPLCEDGSNADLAEKLHLPILLVAEDRLGCLNHILLTAEAIHKRGLSLCAIVLNQKEVCMDEAINNFEDLTMLLDCPIYQFSHDEIFTADAGKSQAMLQTIFHT